MKNRSIKFIFCALSLWFVPALLQGQTVKFKTFGTENGLPQPYIYTLTQDESGFMWFGTDEGVCRYNGTEFNCFFSNDSLAEDFVTSSFTDDQGQVWLGHQYGGISRWNGKNFQPFKDRFKVSSQITDIKQDESGSVWFSTENDGIIRINSKNEIQYFQDEFVNKRIYSLDFTVDGSLMIGAREGLYLYTFKDKLKKNEPVITEYYDILPTNKINCIVKRKAENQYWIGTESEGIYLLIPGRAKSKAVRIKPKTFPNTIIRNLYEDRKGNLWVSTWGHGAFVFRNPDDNSTFKEVEVFNRENGLSSLFINKIYEDFEGNIWIGTFGGGVGFMLDAFFEFYSHSDKEASNNFLSILCERENKWIGTTKGLIKAQTYAETKWEYLEKNQILPNSRITCLYKDKADQIWIGTARNGLHVMDLKTSVIKEIGSADFRSNAINAIESDGFNLWIGTKKGIYTLNSKSGQVYKYTMVNNSVYDILYDSKKQIWITTGDNKVSIINGEKIKEFVVSYSNEVISAVSIEEDDLGNIWVGTAGDGLFKLESTAFRNFSNKEGLKSNYCFSLIKDKKNGLWVGHRLGISRVNCKTFDIKTYGQDEGLSMDCNLNAVTQDLFGNIWFGTNKGAIKYDPEKDKKNMSPPKINLTNLMISDEKQEISDEIILPYGEYRFRMDYIGVSYKENHGITYQYFLDGYDLDWSEPTTSNYVVYNRISDGEYIFYLRACNSDGVCNYDPVEILINVSAPFWKQIWFVVICIIVLVYSIYAYIRYRERSHKKLQKLLQNMLTERTREVINQKEEIERKNQDITDSINYARRIQDAILPDVEGLYAYVPNSFVLYRPRDIVSGDFYWFDFVQNKEKLVIVCADATGHGVPGAFMSIVGSTLIKDLVEKPYVNKPSELLTHLDLEIIKTLKQKGKIEDSSDGMDMIICEVDINNGKLRVASAMRPICIIRKSGEVDFQKGTRHSIGGALEQKTFITQEIDMEKGDTIYMFTDGYADQFGGDKGKKYKIMRFKQKLVEIHKKSMQEQRQILSDEFDDWKNVQYQVDDILVIGIRF